MTNLVKYPVACLLSETFANDTIGTQLIDQSRFLWIHYSAGYIPNFGTSAEWPSLAAESGQSP